ncbi:hypothetical protein BO82DRAFT_356589 [Aspergillus uvarum CBS 121591]|uniref:Uncharacterized protein n=1 Tax=Aspergillus uvarum CBS 121591 TaxID=1448315 RepID=A0A319C5N3_9EURO|nr:hypothetical protein BO82DRAFT_356589 [Aspergillus uvarum CBS 121591]PYH79209.1 hypothetical protein BO82DRAFT_356589 [Aspergillus uvarum CBS 121591]
MDAGDRLCRSLLGPLAISPPLMWLTVGCLATLGCGWWMQKQMRGTGHRTALFCSVA